MDAHDLGQERVSVVWVGMADGATKPASKLAYTADDHDDAEPPEAGAIELPACSERQHAKDGHEDGAGCVRRHVAVGCTVAARSVRPLSHTRATLTHGWTADCVAGVAMSQYAGGDPAQWNEGHSRFAHRQGWRASRGCRNEVDEESEKRARQTLRQQRDVSRTARATRRKGNKTPAQPQGLGDAECSVLVRLLS